MLGHPAELLFGQCRIGKVLGQVAGATRGGGDDDDGRPGTRARRDDQDDGHDEVRIDADSLFGQDTPEPVYHRVGVGAQA